MAADDFYYNSIRFLPANLIFGVGLLVVVGLLLVGPIGFLAAAILIPPTAGVTRMATYLTRERYLFFSEFWEPMRRHPVRVLGLGLAQLALVAVLLVDILIGAGMGNLFGTFLAVSAMYALAILWVYALIAWPLLLDPARENEPARAHLRLGALLLLAHPLRLGAMGAVLGAIALVSTVAIVAIATFVLSFLALAAAHYVLPAADRLEGRATLEVDS